MLFAISYSFRPEHRDAAQARFKKTGGVPPDGARMLGRWHYVGGPGGVFIAESTDAVALGKWLQEWSDVLTFDARPVVNDEDAQKVLGV